MKNTKANEHHLQIKALKIARNLYMEDIASASIFSDNPEKYNEIINTAFERYQATLKLIGEVS